MPTDNIMLYSNYRFDVHVAPGKNTPKHIGPTQLAIASISPLRATCELNAGIDDKPPQSGTHYYDKLEFRRALTADKFLFIWRDNWVQGIKDYRDVRIRQLALDSDEALNEWVLFECWPPLWEGPAFNAMQAAISYERLEIYFARLEWH